MTAYLIAFILSFLITLLATPSVARFAKSRGASDQPNERKVHASAIPRLGGLAIFSGLVLGLGSALLIASWQGARLGWLDLTGIFAGAVLVFAVGVIDDFRSLPAWLKFSVQVIAALLAIWSGVEITFFSTPWDGLIPLGFWALPLTLLWLVGVTNAINLIDGLDGLASGITAIGAITLFVVALRTHQIEAAMVLIALAGATLGFLRYNFYPARIFLGDSGSYLLGFVLASAAIAGVLKSTLLVALLLPILILGIPLYDTASAVFRRIVNKKPVFEADKEHLHHGLLSAGFTQRESVLIIYLACVFLSLAALSAVLLEMGNFFLVLLFMLTALLVSIAKIRESNGSGHE